MARRLLYANPRQGRVPAIAGVVDVELFMGVFVVRTSGLIRVAMAIGMAFFTAVDAEGAVGVSVQTPRVGVNVGVGGMHAGPPGAFMPPPGGRGFVGVNVRVRGRGRCGRFGCRGRFVVRGRCGRGGCGGGRFVAGRGGCFGGGCGMPSMRAGGFAVVRFGGGCGPRRGGCRSRCF